MFFKIGVLKIFENFRGKYLCLSLILTKDVLSNILVLTKSPFLQNTIRGCASQVCTMVKSM